MTISAQGGEVSVALQPGKYGRRGVFDASDLDYYKMRVLSAGLSPIDDTQIFPPEVGGLPVPTGAFKQMIAFGGDINIIPRLKEHLGLILLGALGSVSTSTGVDSEGNSVTGLNTHTFKFKANEAAYQPWLSVRRMVPGRAGERSGETGVDCKVGMFRLGIPARGKLRANFSVLGLDVKFDNAALWEYANSTYENDLSTPDAGRGEFLIGGLEYPVIGAVIEVINALTGPREEGIVGSYRLDDSIALQRGATVRIQVKYENDDLCRQVYTNGPDSVDWNQIPFYTETAGSTKAFEAYFNSPGDISGVDAPYGLRVVADRVVWAMDGPPQLEGASMLVVSFVGTVLEPTSGDYFKFMLENAADGDIYSIAPALQIAFASGLAYSAGDTDLDATAALTSAGISGWQGGKLSVNWGIPSAGELTDDDSFSFDASGDFSESGGVISHSATPIGTVQGGTYNTPLVFRFYAAATDTIINALLKQIQYGRVGDSDSTTVFVATIILEDAAGNTATDSITITHS